MAEKSKLAEVLGLEEDEEFTVKGYDSIFCIHNGKREYKEDDVWCRCSSEAFLTNIINDPSLIIRKPQFNDEEMTFLRLLRKYGKVTEMHKDNGGMAGVGLRGSYGLAFTIADCLLKPGEKIDLDEMFGEAEDG